MALIDFITPSFPKFESFIKDVSEWQKQNLNYTVALYFLEFTISVLKAGDRLTFMQIMELVEEGLNGPPDISDPLCIDFVQRIADFPDVKAEMVAQLGPQSRECYAAQFE
jgi:hypothetical protein